MKKVLMLAGLLCCAIPLLARGDETPSTEWCNSHRAEDGSILWNDPPGTCERYYEHRNDAEWSAMMQRGEENAERFRLEQLDKWDGVRDEHQRFMDRLER
jgi:hypothetical protein